MGASFKAGSSEARKAVEQLFDDSPPILVEVNFSCGVSPDWYLCDDEDELNTVIDRIKGKADIFLNSVWELTGDEKKQVCLTKEAEIG